MPIDQQSEHNNAPLAEHLGELRFRLIRILWIALLSGSACFYFSEFIFEWIRHPIAPYLPEGGLVFTGVIDKFMAHIKISFLAGIILSAPLWLYQVWCFVAPGLYKNEQKYALSFLFFGTFLFICGVLFVYFLVFPAAFQFLLNFGGATDKPMITISEYVSFFVMTTLVFGLSFELPLIIVVLGMIGFVDQNFLREKRRFAIVGIAALSALVTPPDALSMIMLLVPLWILYEISILIVGFFERKPQS